MIDHSQPDTDITPYSPREDNAPIAHDRYGSFVHLGYLIQRMRQPSRMTGAKTIAPERLQDIFPPHVIEDLHKIDWSKCDLPLVFALGSRFTWLWSLRFDQLKARVQVDGDDHIYYNLHTAMESLFRASASLYNVQASARSLVPEHLPEPDTSDFLEPSVQRSTLLAIEFFLRDVAHFAQGHGIDHRPPHINAALYLWDSDFYAYRNRVQEVISRHGSWTGTRIRQFEKNDDVQKRRGVPALVPFRRRKRRTGSLSVAMFAMQRQLALWQAFDALHTSRPPTETEQAVYRIERDVVFASLQGNDNYAYLPFRMDTFIPRFLHAYTETRSLSHDPHPPVERLRMGMDELDRTARHLEESIAVSVGGNEMESWYPAGHFEQYATVLRGLASNRGGSPQALQPVPELDAPEELTIETTPPAPVPEGDDAEERFATASKPLASAKGRPKISLDYDIAVAAWWESFDAFECRRPTQEEVCEHLTAMGYPIRLRTLGKKCSQWRREGRLWPGPRPENPADPA